MRLIPGHIPDAIRRLLPAGDPESLRPAPGPVVTDAERATATRAECKAESDLQERLVAYLTQHRTAGTVAVVVRPPMNRKSQLPLGWPDLTFAYRGRPVAMEVKLPGVNPEPHQAAMHDRMRQDGWLVWIVRSVEQAAAMLDALDHLAETGR